MKLALILFLSLAWIIFPCCGNKSKNNKNKESIQVPADRLQFGTDKRLETLYIVFLFSDYPVLTPFPNAYKTEALVYFAPYKQHRAVQLAKDLIPRGLVADYAVNWLFQHSQFPGLEKTRTIDFPFEARPLQQDSLELFRQALKDFYIEARCDSFFALQQVFLDKMVSTVRDSFTSKDILSVIEEYFGIRKEAKYDIILSPLMHSGGFSIERTDEHELYALIGPNRVEGNSPVFDRTFLEQDLVIHEFSHNYANPIVDQYMNQTKALEKDLFPPVRSSVEQEGYSTWESFMQELVVRATTIRIVGNLYGKEAARDLLDYEKSVGFGYVTELTDELKVYESQRDKYPTLADFYPRLIQRLEKVRDKLK
jgi:hypothetical protein